MGKYELNIRFIIKMSVNSKEISNWNSEDVINWLRDLNLTHYLESFQMNQLTGYDLCSLTNADLKDELKISKYHDRSLIIKSIKEFLLDQRRYYINISQT